MAQESTPNASDDSERFGVYEIDRREDGSLYELGRGAMGVTYRATDTSLQRKVALKIIKIDIAERSADIRERFMREARAAAALRHENIATVYQFGMRLETGQYFYAMELIEGETLDERVHRSRTARCAYHRRHCAASHLCIGRCGKARIDPSRLETGKFDAPERGRRRSGSNVAPRRPYRKNNRLRSGQGNSHSNRSEVADT